MNSELSNNTPAGFSETQRAALLTLLTDEDPGVYQAIRDKILACGPHTCEWLRPHVLSRDPVLRRRTQEIIDRFARDSADSRFLAFCVQHHGAAFDLEQGVWLLAQTRYPKTNCEAYQALLDSYATDLKESIPPAVRAGQVLTTLNDFLFERLGYQGDESDYYHPDNSHLNRVMDRRRGNPISLSLVYLFLARRLRLPVTGIGLPGHFLCRFQNSAEEIYIDVFHRGRFLTKNDCLHHLVKSHYPLDQAYLSPATPHQILTRICANLHQSYLRQEQAEEARRLERYVIALAR